MNLTGGVLSSVELPESFLRTLLVFGLQLSTSKPLSQPLSDSLFVRFGMIRVQQRIVSRTRLRKSDVALLVASSPVDRGRWLGAIDATAAKHQS